LPEAIDESKSLRRVFGWFRRRLQGNFDFESTGRVIMYSILVGVVAGLGAVAFYGALEQVQEWSLGNVAGYEQPLAGSERVSDTYQLLPTLMKDNPPAAADAPLVAKMSRIGLVPGKPFDAQSLGTEVAAALENGCKAGLEKIIAHMSKAGKEMNGWVFPFPGGQYGTEYLQRATITYFGLGCNRTADAVYPTSELGPDGKPYDGANKYTLTFPKGQMPPVSGFWSLTMYNAEYFFVENPLNRYTLSARNTLTPNADGSTTLYIQNENPGPDKQANWLPAPKGRFVLMMRLYWPKEGDPSILNGTWSPPAVTKVN
jgi:hypothetical protein